MVAATMAATLFGAGCAQRLTPDDVRELLDHPKGTVSKDSMSRVTRDLFLADRATSIEGIADLLKTNQASPSGSNAIPGLSAGVLEDAGDVFCVGGLVASIATFDGCEVGDECHAELTLDSCVLRVGDEGADEDARGKIHFKLDNETGGDADVSDLALSFEGWESSRDDKALDSLDGLISLQTNIKHDDSHAEVVFASDVDAKVINKEHGFFEDGVTDHSHVEAGLRFLADTTDTSGSGSLEILTFVDDDASQHNESVSIKIAAEGHQVNASTVTSSADVEIVGENGTFKCTWTGADQEGTPQGEKVSSEGHCVDEDGETFDFSGEATSS
jgi:hypothetical protein